MKNKNLKNTINDRIFDLIKDKKEKNKANQDEQAKGIGISAGALSKYANGNAVPNGETLQKIATYYGCSTNYLLGLNKNPTIDVSDAEITEKLGLSNESINLLKRSKEFSLKYEKVINDILSTEEGMKLLDEMVKFMYTEPIAFTLDKNIRTNIGILNSDNTTTSIDVVEIENFRLFNLVSAIKDIKKHKTQLNLGELHILDINEEPEDV